MHAPLIATPARTQVVVIIARPIPGRGLFDALAGGKVIAAATREPFLAGARALLRYGFDPKLVAVLRHASNPTDSLKAPIGVAGSLTVEETRRGRIRYRRWKGSPSRDGRAPIEKSGDRLGEYRPADEIASSSPGAAADQVNQVADQVVNQVAEAP